MTDCPRCGERIEVHGAVCPACGESIADPTSSFPPVVVDQVEGVTVPAVEEGPALVVTKGPTPGERFFLDASRLSVGRDPGCDIFLNDMTVSRAHAVIEVHGQSIRVTDRGSLNGTYVNGLCVDSADLSHGDILQIGTFQMVLVGGAAAQ